MGQRPVADADPTTAPTVVRVARSVGLSVESSAEIAHLPERQRARLDRIGTSRARSDFVAARALARGVVAELVGVDRGRVRLRQSCPACGGEDHGRPRAEVDGRPLDALTVSWSHGDGVVAAAAGRGVLGIDVEQLPATPFDPDLLRATLAARELDVVLAATDPAEAYLRTWTLKEALVKCCGLGLDEVAGTSLEDLLARVPGTATVAWTDPRSRAVVGLAVGGVAGGELSVAQRPRTSPDTDSSGGPSIWVTRASTRKARSRPV